MDTQHQSKPALNWFVKPASFVLSVLKISKVLMDDCLLVSLQYRCVSDFLSCVSRLTEASLM